MRKKSVFTKSVYLSVLLAALSFEVSAGPLPDGRWDLLTISYPADRDVEIGLGGSDKTLTAKGTCRVKWQKGTASLAIEIRDLSSPAEAGWANQQYVLWAFDQQKHAINLGVVPLRGKSAKWSVQMPARAFGLLVTAEQDPKTSVPSPAVAMESLLPTDPDLVLPAYRVVVDLGPQKG